MEIMTAINTRRSIRRYKKQAVTREMIEKLLETAIMAPSASNSQPWAFAVIQDEELLKSYSDRAKTYLLDQMADRPDPNGYKAALSNPNFNIFYNAGSLVIIYSKSNTQQATGDCCLAAQNFMLSAHADGLGTCWIGFSLPFLNSDEAKDELGVPQTYTAVASLIVGYPELIPSAFSRKPPEILFWKK